MKGETWTCKPGGWDVLNTTYIPETDSIGYPIIRDQVHDIPTQLIPYTDWKKYQPGNALHFFVDDYRFEHLWRTPGRYLSRLNGLTVLSPDFSLYIDYPEPVQRWNIYRSRWLGAYWQGHGVTVIPTITWSDENSFSYCFAGLEYGSIVAISTLGCRDASKEFTNGVDTMIDLIGPRHIICYGILRKIYYGRKSIPNHTNYPYNFGTHAGKAQQYQRLENYL